MPYSEYINEGLAYLFNSQNKDGGIAIGCPSDSESGIWTTAEALDAVLTSNFLQFNISVLDNVFSMANFILEKFIVQNNEGYWEIADGDGPSTATTGHAIHSLHIFSTKVLTNCDIESIGVSDKLYNIAQLKQKISIYIDKAISWLRSNQQLDNGWGHSCKSNQSSSSVLCTYYVLKGFNTLGLINDRDFNVTKANMFIKQKIQGIITKKEKTNDTNLAEILYGYTSLVNSNFFVKADDQFKKTVLKYIKRHWKEIKLCVASPDIRHQEEIFVNNMPYIALNAFLTAEEYAFASKISKLIKYLISLKQTDGSWAVTKPEKKETTWVTAEIVLVLHLAQTKFEKYQRNILGKKKLKVLIFSNIVLCLISSAFLLYYFSQQIIASGNILVAIPNAIIAVLGVVSSIISIIGVFKS